MSNRARNILALFWMACAFFSIWLGFPNDFAALPPLVLFWPLALSALGLQAQKCKTAFMAGWLCTFAGFAAALYWLAFPVRYVGGLPWPLAMLCALAISAALSLQGGFFCAAAFFARGMKAWFFAPFLALIWYLLEWSFAIVLGFPWLPLAGALAPWPILTQMAAIFGAYFTGALWLCACLFIFASFRRELFSGAAKKFSPVPFLAGLLIIACGLAWGIHSLQAHPSHKKPAGTNSMAALFVEGNVDQNQKWDRAFQTASLDLYIKLTEDGLAAAEKAGINEPLIIWPETALPFFFENRPDLALLTRNCARKANCPLLFGAPGVSRVPGLPEEAVFNRAFLLGPSGKTLGYYDKEHLVPFGEYLPQWLKFDFLEALLQGVGIYHEGRETAPLLYGRLALGILICYEGIFPWLAQERTAAGANILVDISNDGWFGDSPAGRQHLYLTILRCLEQNRWLLRGTNTGISAIADSRGRLVLEGPRNVAGYIFGRASLERDASLYHYLAPYLPVMALLAALCLAAAGRKKLGKK